MITMTETKNTRFQQKFPDETYIKAMETDGLYTAAYIGDRVGCHTRTAATYLQKLAAANRINAVLVDEGKSTLYQKKQRRIPKQE